jgi:hypothetical protein
MGALLVPVVVLIVLLVVAAVAVHRLQAENRPTLRYEVPAGQDPALVLAGLRQAGFDASADSEPGPSSPIVIIGATGGAPDREAVRRTLADLDGTNVKPEDSAPVERPRVTFTDE